LEPLEDDSRLNALAVANHARSYDRIKRKLIENGYRLRIAAGSYVSMEYK